MEVALLRAGTFAGLHRAEQIEAYPEVAEQPFDSRSKRMATVHRHEDGYFAAVKGAPEAVLPAAERIAGADDTPARHGFARRLAAAGRSAGWRGTSRPRRSEPAGGRPFRAGGAAASSSSA